MFKKGNAIVNTGSKDTSIISFDTKIIGNIESNGDIRVEGQLEGTLTCKGLAVIGANAKINGSIQGNNIEVWGTVEGEIIAIGLVSLKGSAVILGDLTVGKLLVEPGANFMGNCKMTDDNKKQILLTSKATDKV